MFIESIRTRVKGKSKRVVFPEGGEERALHAAARALLLGRIE
jgi:phosphotransacetylase